MRASGVAMGALLLSASLLGCLEEDKGGCRHDGDCRGVNVCRDSVCVTPDGFSDEDLLRDFGIDAPGDQGQEGVEGRECDAQGEQGAYEWTVVTDGIEIQALAAGVTGTISDLQGLGGAAEAWVLLLDDGSSVFVEYGAVGDGEFAALDVGQTVVLRYVEVVDGQGLSSRVLEVLRVDDGRPVVGLCDVDPTQAPCMGSSWGATAGGGAVCPTIELECGLASDGPVDFVGQELPMVNLYAGQRQRLEEGGGLWHREVFEARQVEPEPECPDVASRRLRAAQILLR